jgi:polyribonucleotide nucleotidyltransferase
MQELKDSKLDLVVAGTKEGVLMVESEAQELNEEIMLGAVMFGHGSVPARHRYDYRYAKCAPKTRGISETPGSQRNSRRKCELVEADLRESLQNSRQAGTLASSMPPRKKIIEAFRFNEKSATTHQSQFKELEADIVRTDVLKTGRASTARHGKPSARSLPKSASCPDARLGPVHPR